MTENEIATVVVDAANQVYITLGPGLLEMVYMLAMVYELKKHDLDFTVKQSVPIIYDGVQIAEGYRADLIVEDKVIIEIKSVERTIPVHKKQLLTYLRMADKRLGLLINFGAPLIEDGITRIINDFEES